MSSQPPAPPDDPEEAPTYEVGYGKPPQATRFQPGKSGNPKGRPKGSRKAPPADAAVEKLKALVLQEAYRPIQIRDGETLVELPHDTGGTAQRHPQCGQGKPAGAAPAPRHRRRNRGRATPRSPEALRGGGRPTRWKARGRSRWRAARHLPAPVLVPHPDHLIIDPITGSVKLRGPFTREEKVEWDEHTAMKADIPEAAHRAGGGAAGRTPQPQSEEADRGLSVSDCPVDTALNSFERISCKACTECAQPPRK